MIDANNKDRIMCFYILISDSKEYFGIGQFEVDGGSFRRSNVRCKNQEIDEVASIKSVLSPDSKTAFICVLFTSGENNCFSYDNTNSYSSGFNFNNFNCNDKICQTNDYSLKVDYFSDNQKYIFGCSGEDNNITTCIFNQDFSISEEINNKYISESEGNINSFSFVYSSEDQKYYIIMDEIFEEKIEDVLITTYIKKTRRRERRRKGRRKG